MFDIDDGTFDSCVAIEADEPFDRVSVTTFVNLEKFTKHQPRIRSCPILVPSFFRNGITIKLDGAQLIQYHRPSTLQIKKTSGPYSEGVGKRWKNGSGIDSRLISSDLVC